MMIKNLISVAAVVFIVMLVWRLAAGALYYVIVAGVIYLIYTMFVASSVGSKKE